MEVLEITPGIVAIAKEREEQINKHKFDADHDRVNNSNEELLKMAKYLLTNNDMSWPKSVSLAWKRKFDGKTNLERLVLAGALIAAEIDRQKAEQDANPKSKW